MKKPLAAFAASVAIASTALVGCGSDVADEAPEPKVSPSSSAPASLEDLAVTYVWNTASEEDKAGICLAMATLSENEVIEILKSESTNTDPASEPDYDKVYELLDAACSERG